MTSTELPTDAVRHVEAAVARRLGYLCRLRNRLMQAVEPDDPLVLDAERAYVAVHALRIRLHYLTCRNQTGG